MSSAAPIPSGRGVAQGVVPILLGMARTTQKARGSVAASTTMKDFGPRLQHLREARNLSRIELAKLLGVENVQVYRYEKGENLPSAETIVKLAELLQVTTDELLKGGANSTSAPKIRSPKLLDRFQTLDQLPKERQDVALQLLDAIISQHELESLPTRIRRTG